MSNLTILMCGLVRPHPNLIQDIPKLKEKGKGDKEDEEDNSRIKNERKFSVTYL